MPCGARSADSSPYVEMEDDYGSTIGIGRNDLELQEKEVKFLEFIYNNCRGIINIFDENNIIQTINFNELNIHSFIRFEGRFSGYAFSCKKLHKGWYGFRPEIFSTSKRIIGINIRRSYMRK